MATSNEWNPREPFLKALVLRVPSILKSQDPENGRFGTPPWICTDQNAILPLAAAWAIKDPTNPYYHNPVVLEAIMKGGDALIADQDENGMWTYRNKDNSTWGQILMPWTYSRWIRTFQLIKDSMPAGRRERWEEGLILGFESISKRELVSIANIPTLDAMSLYCAGLCFNRDDWKQQAKKFIDKVIAAQSPDGWWSEHSGPVVGYNLLYVEALGFYYAMSHDARVLEALRRAAVFHRAFTYPDGSRVETVDERNPYSPDIATGNVGFSFTPEGRGFLLHQYSMTNWDPSADEAANFLLYGETGDAAPSTASDEEMTVIGNNDALVLRKKPWFISVSAFVAKPSDSRWIQDRQNFVSIYHDRAGLIAGGGNTKLQPFWSNFTFGDTSLLRHNAGDETPDFMPRGDLLYVPSSASLHPDKNAPGIDLNYGEEHCRITVRPLDDKRLTITAEVSGFNDQRPSEGHIDFLPAPESALKTAKGKSAGLDEKPIDWNSEEIGEWFEYGDVRIHIPAGARLLWPEKSHNPYKKDGSSTLAEARLVLCLPFSSSALIQNVQLEVLESPAAITAQRDMRKFPYPFTNMVSILSDTDLTDVEEFENMHRFLNTEEECGILGKGVGLDVGDTFWMDMYDGHDHAHDQLDNKSNNWIYWHEGKDIYGGLMRKYLKSGWIDAPYTFFSYYIGANPIKYAIAMQKVLDGWDPSSNESPFRREAEKVVDEWKKIGYKPVAWIDHANNPWDITYFDEGRLNKGVSQSENVISLRRPEKIPSNNDLIVFPGTGEVCQVSTSVEANDDSSVLIILKKPLQNTYNSGERLTIHGMGVDGPILGAVPGSPYYSIDLALKAGIKFFWTKMPYSLRRTSNYGKRGFETSLVPFQLPDSSKVWGFFRYYESDEVDNANLGKCINRLITGDDKGGPIAPWTYSIIATHLGVARKPGQRRSNDDVYTTNGGRWFNEETVAALRNLRSLQDKGRVLVAQTSRLLKYNLANDMLTKYANSPDGFTREKIGDAEKIIIHKIHDDVFGSFVPGLDDVRGITFYTDNPAKTGIFIGNDLIDKSEIQINPPDQSGRASTGIRWFKPDINDYTKRK
jgi:hypothetical protein